MPTYKLDDKEVTLRELISHLASQGDEAEFVPKSRLANEKAARKAAEESLEAAQEAGKNGAKAMKELEVLRSENTELRTGIELGAAGVTDPKLQRSVRAIYAAEMDGVEKPPSLADWVKGDGAKHPLVKHALTPPAAGAGDGKGKPRVDTGGGASPGTTPAGSKMTPQQLSAYFASPAYRAMDAKGRQAKRAELQAQLGAADAASGGGAAPGVGDAGAGNSTPAA